MQQESTVVAVLDLFHFQQHKENDIIVEQDLIIFRKVFNNFMLLSKIKGHKSFEGIFDEQNQKCNSIGKLQLLLQIKLFISSQCYIL